MKIITNKTQYIAVPYSPSDGVITEGEALELLRNNVIPGDAQWSAVYNLTKRKVWITFAPEYEKVYEYDL